MLGNKKCPKALIAVLFAHPAFFPAVKWAKLCFPRKLPNFSNQVFCSLESI